MNVGDRVGAIAMLKDGVAEIFGFGVYKGKLVPNYEGDRGSMADDLKEAQIENPTIELDNGELVYGCECWWSSEDKVNEMLKNCTEIKTVS